MSDWVQKQASNHSLHVAGAAILSGVAVAGSILGYQHIRRKEAVERLKQSIPKSDPSVELTKYGTAKTSFKPNSEDERSFVLAQRAQAGDYSEDLILEQLARNRVFLGDDGLAKLRDSFVVVVGVGGVGSHATTALARSGVSRLRIIDFDQVTLSSLNRHAVATLADVGSPKVQTMKKRLMQITPWTKLDVRDELFGANDAEKLLAPWKDGDDERKPDFVIDCIDNITSKVELLHYCHKNGIKVISSMGAGCKSDPTRIAVGDISLSTDDPLSRSTRRRLKLLGVSTGIPVVFSTEKPGPGKASLLPLPEEEFQKGSVGELGVLPDFRVRILPVLGTMPAAFGYTIANHVICSLAGYPMEYNPGGKFREKMYDGILGALQGQEERLARVQTGVNPIGLKLPITKEDISYLVEEVYRGRSVVSGLSTRLALTRWKKPANGFGAEPELAKEGQRGVRFELKDLVCMTKEEASRHEREVLLGGKDVSEVYDAKVIETVEKRIREEEQYEKYR
ncbi:hypothetical protein KEM56_004426 [Ascosphaera pollenicola]|nr:hypothetical protein KEM56_004426 [Ascosphaera pollenicola]